MKKTTAVAVRCIETGQTWESMSECARNLGISNFMLYDHIRFGEPAKGLHFEKTGRHLITVKERNEQDTGSNRRNKV